MCYLSPEGAVLGADSTSSAPIAFGYHYLNYNQKLFELGEKDSTVGVLTWGLAGLSTASYRTLLARLADDLKETPPDDLKGIADRWASQFWAVYSSDPQLKPYLAIYQALAAKPRHDPQDPASRTKDEEQKFTEIGLSLPVGFCIAGYWLPDRSPAAFEVSFGPGMTAPPAPVPLPSGTYFSWGVPNMITRLIDGVDPSLGWRILNSGKWNGTQADLKVLLDQCRLAHPLLPIRDAIDFVHSCIFSTIKAMKFSTLSQVCGGPIEVAVITSDRRFRWVQHKEMNAAIMEGTP